MPTKPAPGRDARRLRRASLRALAALRKNPPADGHARAETILQFIEAPVLAYLVGQDNPTLVLRAYELLRRGGGAPRLPAAEGRSKASEAEWKKIQDGLEPQS